MVPGPGYGGSGSGLGGSSVGTGLSNTSQTQGSNINNVRPTDACPQFPDQCNPVFVLEKHLSVIRKGPTSPPHLQMYKFTEETAAVSGDTEGKVTAQYSGERMWGSWNWCNYPNVSPCTSGFAINTRGRGFDGEDISEFYHTNKSQKKHGDKIVIPIDISLTQEDWDLNDKLMIEHEYTDVFGAVKKAVAMVSIDATDYIGDPSTGNVLSPFNQVQQFVNAGIPTIECDGIWGSYSGNINKYIVATIISITGNFPKYISVDDTGQPTGQDIYKVKLIQNAPLFKQKFPKFAYRYKYEDGEYSVFSPWSEVAFIPESFDYLPKKGYNLGMENGLRSLRIMNFIPKDIPDDVIQVDILYKESNKPGIYTVASIKRDDQAESGQPYRPWETPGIGENFGNYKIKSELIHKVVPSNQLLRPWDNVPKQALAQEITANRIIYANYLENYDVLYYDNGKTFPVVPRFVTNIEQVNHSLTTPSPDGPRPGHPAKSLKSMRTYQLGVVYRDRYGRETPVLTDKSGSFKLDKEYAVTQNRLQVKIDSNPPYWAESYTFYIKETSNEYYNIAMDRWYDAEDGGIWLSFPSAERNKITDRTTLLLKKQHNSNAFTSDNIDYKVLSVKNDAPTFIKTDIKYWGSLPMCLPPPGWGDVGNWDSGMFYPTGLPLPQRMYIDVYAEYWDQSVFKSLSGRDGAQIRVIQSAGQAAAYNAGIKDSTNKTRWYNVANIEYIGAPAQTFEKEVTDDDGITTISQVEETGQMARLVRVSLEKAFGHDADFCKPEYNDYFNQPANSTLDKGLSLEARTKDVKDGAQFEGRFFVKVLRDYNIDQNIVNPQQEFSDKFQVLQSKDIRYIAAGHPGLQDWCTDTSNTTCTNAFVPIGTENMSTVLQPKIVSSFGYFHLNKGVHYLDINGAAQVSPVLGGPGLKWPMGPSSDTDGTYHSGWWKSRYQDFLNGPGFGGSENNWPDEHPNNVSTDWPSYSVGSYNPYMCYFDCDNSGNNINLLTWAPFAQNNVGNNNDHPYHNGASAPRNRVNNVNPNGILQLYKAIPFQDSSGVSNPYDPGLLFDDNSYLDGGNPYQIPAIWGDESDILTTPPVWKTDTIEKLREDWYYLWRGRDDVHLDWPLGRFHANRWIIDKAGAAEGYSGNGIWDDGNVSYMDLAYWGIGSESEYNRKNTNQELMMIHQQTEIPFADAMSTVGTQFRFQQDPDQTIYTVTNVEVDDEVWNYEAPQGSWAYEDEDGNITDETKGGGIGKGHLPPWGGGEIDSSLSGGRAFISDLFSSSKKKTGGAPYNRRIRFTITLDKIIGMEGGAGFHPILNHVDKDGNANVKSGKVRYDADAVSGHITTAKGGTPLKPAGGDFYMYNLASYWNASSTPTLDQPDTIAAQAAGQYIGLHERGLNETTIEIVTPYKGEDKSSDRMSTNPAIWETEPLEDVGLDIYYAASPTYPVKIKRFRRDYRPNFGPDYLDNYNANWYDYGLRGEEIIPVGSDFTPINTGSPIFPASSSVCAVQNNTIWLMPLATSPGQSAFEDSAGNDVNLDLGCEVKISYKGEGTYYGAGYDLQEITLKITKQLSKHAYQVEIDTHNANRQLGYFNCYSYGTGVESNRIRDDYNAVTIDKGVKASMPLAEQYKEERKGSSLIFSGIYNSTSGVNRTNQFIQAEPITKDLNPVNGTIQKLYARDTDLLTFCENKVFKILAKKDALFNADGNTNVTSNKAVLGQTIPFTGEYGISKNPESFAAESYRVYFADKARGTIMRLQGDGLMPISDAGMRDWFKDNLRFASSIIGSYDDREDQYNITIETSDQDGNNKAYTVSWVESKKGWVSFKSFLQEGGISHKNIYYSFPSNNYSPKTNKDPWGISYYIPGSGRAETWQHHLDLIIKRDVLVSSNSSNVSITVSNGQGSLIEGMHVEGNGIHVDTLITSVNCTPNGCVIILSNPARVENGDQITFTTPRNSFYGNDSHYSMLKVLFNQAQGTVKRFKTLDYEGTQAKTIKRINNKQKIEGQDLGQIYYDNYAKHGWFVKNMFTDMQEGYIPEFIDKENKWYNFVRSYEDAGIHDRLDTSEFSLQGLGYSNTNITPPPPDPDPDPVVTSWNCVLGVCIDPLDGSGYWNDDNSAGNGYAACQMACGINKISFTCVNGSCFDPGDGTGIYSSYSDCSNNCASIPETWNCIDAGTSNAICVDPGDGSGDYSTAAACWSNCSNYPITWDCVLHQAFTSPHFYSTDQYICEDPGNGQGLHQTQAACQAACFAPPQETWNCDSDGGCIDPGDGTGNYSTLAACQASCNWYCDDNPNDGIGCNQIGQGTFVGAYCDPNICTPSTGNANYNFFCVYDSLNGPSVGYYYYDDATISQNCGGFAYASTSSGLVDGAQFYNETDGVCSTFMGTTTGNVLPQAGDSVVLGGVTWYYLSTMVHGCLDHTSYCSTCSYYPSGGSTDAPCTSGCNLVPAGMPPPQSQSNNNTNINIPPTTRDSAKSNYESKYEQDYSDTSIPSSPSSPIRNPLRNTSIGNMNSNNY